MEMENEHLTFKHNEETKKNAEKFFIFIKICKKFITKIKKTFCILNELEQKNIKTIIDKKNMIYKEINLIIEEFGSTINNPDIINNLQKSEIDHKLLDILEKNNEEDISKIFNFIEIISKLELTNKKLNEQNEILNRRMKNDVIFYIK